jgi:hypothetical protein
MEVLENAGIFTPAVIARSDSDVAIRFSGVRIATPSFGWFAMT